MNSILPDEVDVKSVQALLDRGDEFLLLDCREQEEYELVRLPAACHIPIGEIAGRLSELSDHREDRIVVYCHHGGRSQMVTQFLREQGFAQAQNMRGGIDAWATDVDTSLRRY